jgi:integrase
MVKDQSTNAMSVDLGRINGKRRRKTIYGKTRKEVADKLKALHRDQAAGTNIQPDQYTVEQFIYRWLNEIICHRRPRTRESYEATARKYICPYVGQYKLHKLLPEHVQTMANALLAKGLGTRSAEYACLVLSRALNQAIRWGYVHRNVVDGVELPKVKQRKVQPADEHQVKALLNAVKGHRLKGVYWLAIFLGLRRGEVLGLLKENIDFEAKTITVDGSIQRIGKKLERTEPKTETSRRVLPMPEPVARVLRAHLVRVEADRSKAGETWEEHGYLFPSARGTPLESGNLLRHFKDVLAEAKLPASTRFHDLRHWCASLLIASQVHPKAIQEILGHANIATTMNIYGHLLPNVLRDATDRIGAFAPDEGLEESEENSDESEDNYGESV